jgi:hypothetical protein
MDCFTYTFDKYLLTIVFHFFNILDAINKFSSITAQLKVENSAQTTSRFSPARYRALGCLLIQWFLIFVRVVTRRDPICGLCEMLNSNLASKSIRNLGPML